MDAFHLPIDLVADNGHRSICLVCDREIIVYGVIGSDLLTLEEPDSDLERPATPRLRRDQIERPDGRMSVRLHDCKGQPAAQGRGAGA